MGNIRTERNVCIFDAFGLNLPVLLLHSLSLTLSVSWAKNSMISSSCCSTIVSHWTKKEKYTLKPHPFFLCSSLGCAGGLSGKNYTHRKLHAGCNPWIQRGLRQVHGLAAPRLDPDVRFPVCGGIRALAVVPHPLAYALHELQEVSFWACQRNLVVSELFLLPTHWN